MSDAILVHVGDLHFGRDADLAQVAALEKFVSELRPDAVCITGDLTQRSRHGELQRARASGAAVRAGRSDADRRGVGR